MSSLVRAPDNVQYYAPSQSWQYYLTLCVLAGPAFSSTAVPTAVLAGVYSTPIVSTASASRLSDDVTFPTFNRLVPSDVLQAAVAVSLITYVQECHQPSYAAVDEC